MHRAILKQEHPKPLVPFLPEIRTFAEYNHYNILNPILQYVRREFSSVRCGERVTIRLLARGMELPENTFVDFHHYENKGEGWSKPLHLR